MDERDGQDEECHQVAPPPQALPHPLLTGNPTKKRGAAGDPQGGGGVQEGDHQLQQLLRQISQPRWHGGSVE